MVLCDQNIAVCRKFPRYIQIDGLNKLMQEFSEAIVIIAINNEEAVKEVYQTMLNIGLDQNRIYKYIPETIKEWKQRKFRDGFFNGQKNFFIMANQEADDLLQTLIRGIEPFFYSRWGSVEGNIVYRNRIGILDESDCKVGYTNAGIFPVSNFVIQKYICITEEAARQIDVLCMGFWYRQIEELYRAYSPQAKLMYYGQGLGAWTQALKGMKVLVIHPFTALIEKQYQRREKLFGNSQLLPAFELKTYKAIQSIGGNEKYASWIEALNKMKKDISLIDFDIALLGCGAYGMPLGAFIKQILHKKAMHIGGALQTFFGIKGKRWDNAGIYNEFWVRPTDDLKPKNYKIVEDGCYW